MNTKTTLIAVATLLLCDSALCNQFNFGAPSFQTGKPFRRTVNIRRHQPVSESSASTVVNAPVNSVPPATSVPYGGDGTSSVNAPVNSVPPVTSVPYGGDGTSSVNAPVNSVPPVTSVPYGGDGTSSVNAPVNSVLRVTSIPYGGDETSSVNASVSSIPPVTSVPYGGRDGTPSFIPEHSANMIRRPGRFAQRVGTQETSCKQFIDAAVNKLRNNSESSLYLVWGGSDELPIIEALSENTSVTRLYLPTGYINPRIVKVLENREIPLEELTVSGEMELISPILKAVVRHPNALKELRIDSLISEEAFQELLSSLPKFTNLQRLEIGFISPSESSKEKMFTVLEQMTNLKCVKFKPVFSKEEMNAHGWFEKNSGYERK